MEKAVSDKIISLVGQYSFDQLNAEQRALVLAEWTEQEYNAYQLMLKETMILSKGQSLSAPASIHHQLQDQLSSAFAKPQGGLKRILTTGVPLWLVGLLAASFCLFWSISRVTEKPVQDSTPMVEQMKEVPTYIYLTDTIYQEVKSDPIVINREVIKYVEVEVPVFQESGPAYIAGSQKELGLIPSTDSSTDYSFDASDKQNAPENFAKSIGQSVSDDGALMELLDRMN